MHPLINERPPTAICSNGSVYLLTRFDQTELSPRQAIAAGMGLMRAAVEAVLR